MIRNIALAGSYKGAVVGTDNAAKTSQDFSKFGDGGADILPLYRLNKRQGKQLLAALGTLILPSIEKLSPTTEYGRGKARHCR